MNSLQARRFIASAVVALIVLAACGSDKKDPVKAAQANVSAKEKAATEAQSAFTSASAAFCNDAKTYIAAIDRYGKLFDESAATVGDVKTAGDDLARPRENVNDSAEVAVQASAEVAKANQEFADAKVALAQEQTAAAGSSTTTVKPASTTTTTLVPTAVVDRVKKAESDLAAAGKGVTDETPLVRATAEYNSAAFALEAAWLRLFAEAGCLTTEQQQKAEASLHEYTIAIQTALQTTGYYAGNIDGIYGPSTVEAVKKLQAASSLPQTGYVDRATAAALNSAIASKGGAVASQALAQTAAVQSTLKLGGYWTGPVDGKWTPELTDALKKFQTDLGVPATGAVDVATLSALQAKIASAQSTPTTTPPTTPSTPTT